MQLPKSKYWNTWHSKSPAIMEFLPAKFGIKIGAYSDEAGKYTYFPMGKNIRLLEHHPDGDYVHLEVEHAGAVFSIEYIKTDEWTVIGKVKNIKKSIEWGLRYWLLISFGFFENGQMEYEESVGAFGSKRSYEFASAVKDKPLVYEIVDDADNSGHHMEETSMYAPNPAHKQSGKWVVNKYHLEETPELLFAVSVANSQEEAKQKADHALIQAEQVDALKTDAMSGLSKQTGSISGAMEAIRDVMAWNNIADEKNNRCYTYLTRTWIEKMHGGAVFSSDISYHALMNAWTGDWTMAVKNFQTVMDNIVPAGNFACLMGEHTEWVDRSQPAVIAFMIWKYFLLTGDRQVLMETYPTLLKAHEWWYENRDGNGNGVLELGSSNTGNGHFVGTKMAAKDEAAMDNSPMYDTAQFNQETRTMNMEDIAMNSLLVLDAQCLSLMAKELGEYDTAETLEKQVMQQTDAINEILWDEERGIYANRHWTDGFVTVSPTSFYPLAGGIANESQLEKLIDHMFDEEKFWTNAPFPSITKEDPAVHDNSYWRGRMWAPLNFFTYIGLKRYRKDEEAFTLAKRSMEIFNEYWISERACYENYNSFTGQGSDSVDADPFYGWGALLPFMWVLEHIDVDTWNGFHFGNVSREDYSFCNVKMADGTYTIECLDGVTKLFRNKQLIFSSDAKGRFRHFKHTEHYCSVKVDPQQMACYVDFSVVNPHRVVVNQKEVPIHNHIAIPEGHACVVELWY